MRHINEDATAAAAVAEDPTDAQLVEAELEPSATLKAKKNKSNLFLIKSYSFIDKTNDTNNNNNSSSSKNKSSAKKSKAKAKLSTVSVPPTDLLRPLHLDSFGDFESMLLAQVTVNDEEPSAKQKKSKKKKKSKESSQNGDETESQLRSLLRRKPTPPLSHVAIHEYEEIHQSPSPNSTLPRPQSLPAKVHFELAAEQADQAAQLPQKRSSANIKRESFIRQSLLSLRRSFGSSKQSQKLAQLSTAPANGCNCSVSGSSNCSSTSSTTSSCTSSSAQHTAGRLDELLPIFQIEENDDLQLSEHANPKSRSASSVSTLAAANGQTTSAEHSNNIDEQLQQRGALSMAALQLPGADGNATTKATATTATGNSATLNEQQQLRRQQYCQQLSLPETFPSENINSANGNTTKDRSLRHSYSSSLSPLAGVQLQPSGSVRSLASSSSPSSISGSVSGSASASGSYSAAGNGSCNGINTAKQHDQQTSAVAAISSTSAAAAAVSSTSTAAGAAVAANANVVPADKDKEKDKDKDKDKDKEKEKKRKEVSTGRVKKFHRHFSQVSKDEKLINYFSCALVSDILLQGHLYITEQHFAFYSNVFGYVTKVVIPISSVTKITKEKTAKIIPNAVGVATADERHVFGSFISRESAFRLMCTVCSQLPTANAEALPKQTVDIEISEEYLIEDDSSCSISGNESSPQLLEVAATAVTDSAAAVCLVAEPQAMLRQRSHHSNSNNISNSSGSSRHSDLQAKNSTTSLAVGSIGMRSSAPPAMLIVAGSQSSSSSSTSASTCTSTSTSASTSANVSAASTGPSSSSSPITVVGMGPSLGAMGGGGQAAAASASTHATHSLGNTLRSFGQTSFSRLRRQLPLPTELHVLYLGVMLAVMLALFSVFLLYRILDIEAKTSLYNKPVDFNWRSGNDEDIFAEALRFQKELQAKSTEEAQHILSKNLEQISKVRRSLETLSMLIHDRSSAVHGPSVYAQAQAHGQQAINTQQNRDDSD